MSTHPALNPDTGLLPSRIFNDDEPVWPEYPSGPAFGHGVWNLSSIRTRRTMAERNLTFDNLLPSWSLDIREVLAFQAQLQHPALVSAGIVLSGRKRAIAGIASRYQTLHLTARWFTHHGIEALSDLDQNLADQFLEAIIAGQHRPNASDVAPVGKERQFTFVTGLRLMHTLSPALTSGGLDFKPWGNRRTESVLNLKRSVENVWAPLPFDVWAPVVSGAWAFIDRFAADVLRMIDVARSTPPHPRGAAEPGEVERRIDAYLQNGGKIPLHTGHGNNPRPRGIVNRTLLAHHTKVNQGALTSPSSPKYNQRLWDRVERLAQDPRYAWYGGLTDAEVLVPQPDGTLRPWVDELGRYEVEYLGTLLRAAAYVVIAALTGMRDSEIQSLGADCIGETDGQPAIGGQQFKGIDGGEPLNRWWWAPWPVLRAVEVLSRLTPLPEVLLARTENSDAGYQPTRDIRRLFEFINAEPDKRIGRGGRLGIGRAPVERHQIVQSTLRRSFAVYCAMYPGAELGLGIQLGHSALRMTSGYATDGQQQAVALISDERRRIARNLVGRVVRNEETAVGALRREVDAQFKAQVITDAKQADRIAEQISANLHLGVTNDCLYNASRAPKPCENGPAFMNHRCVGEKCDNATWTQAHIPVLSAHVDRLEDFIDGDRVHPEVRASCERDRRRHLVVIDQLRSTK